MKIIREEANYKPIVITLETLDEAITLYYALAYVESSGASSSDTVKMAKLIGGTLAPWI